MIILALLYLGIPTAILLAMIWSIYKIEETGFKAPLTGTIIGAAFLGLMYVLNEHISFRLPNELYLMLILLVPGLIIYGKKSQKKDVRFLSHSLHYSFVLVMTAMIVLITNELFNF